MSKIFLVSNVEKGIWCFRRELLERLCAEGYEVTLLCPRDAYYEAFLKMGVRRICNCLSRHGVNPFAELGIMIGYWRLFRRERPDVVLTYTIKPNVYAGLVCRLLGIPVIANVTGVGNAFIRRSMLSRIAAMLLRAGLKKAKRIFFQNTANLDLFLSLKIVRKEQTELLPGSGVNLDHHAFQEYPAAEEPIRFLMVARKCTDKGIFEYLEAAKRIHAEFPSVEFHMAGPDEEPTFAAASESARTGGFLIDHGSLPSEEIPSLVGHCHAMVLPTWHEGMSNVLLEAAAAGRPGIASNIPGCREIVDDGATGFLFSPKDVESQYAALRKFLALSPVERASMGRAAREKVAREFDRRIVLDAYGKVIHELCRLPGTVKKR